MIKPVAAARMTRAAMMIRMSMGNESAAWAGACVTTGVDGGAAVGAAGCAVSVERAISAKEVGTGVGVADSTQTAGTGVPAQVERG